MARYDFKIAFRSFKKHKAITLINLAGLSFGISSCLVIFLYVKSELTYNQSYRNSDRIVRVVSDIKTPEAPIYLAKSPVPLAIELKSHYPEVKDAARLLPTEAIIKYDGHILRETNVYFSEPSVFNVLGFPLLQGDPKDLLGAPNSAVITRTVARKYFGKESPLNRTIKCNGQDYTIKGVMEDLPGNSDLKVSILLSRDYSASKDWVENLTVYTYVLFNQVPDQAAFEKKLVSIANTFANPAMKALGAEGYSFEFKVEPLSAIHYARSRMEDSPKGNRQLVYLFSFLAIIVLAIALLNYVNLLTARAPERAKEVGIKKVNGAGRWGLTKQFLLESLILSMVAILFSALFIFLLIPLLNEKLQISLQWEFSPETFYVLLALLAASLISGLYPALVMSGYNPIVVLKGKFANYGRGLLMRKCFTTFQFILTVGMIAGIIIIYRQMNFLRRYDLGFDKERVLNIRLPQDTTVRKSAGLLANEFRRQKNVKDASVGTGIQPEGTIPMGTTFIRDGKGVNRQLMCNYLFMDEKTTQLLDLKILKGRNITSDPADRKAAFIVNEAFVKNAGLSDALGRDIQGFDHKGKIIGVVKNFNYQSIHTAIEPLIMIYNTSPAEIITLKLQTDALDGVRAVWQRYFPDFPFEYSFLDEAYDTQYKSDRTLATLFLLFTFLVAFISFLGMYALLSLNIFQRTKEIGMRKVLGASRFTIFLLLYKDFLVILIISIFLATPLTWIGMNSWLRNFAYRQDIQWWIFPLSGLITLVLSLSIVYYKIFRVTARNPVNAIRIE
jgi:putative ABC transport system permease protein